MIEVELKSVVDDLDACRERLERAGGRLTFVGTLEDRRYDTEDRSLGARDHVLRSRVYREAGTGESRAELGWKGTTEYVDGYKQREEIACGILGPDDLAELLTRLGYRVTMAIDREIWQYDFAGAIVRFERYPVMDDLVEVEGDVASIERAISALGLPRDGFTTDRLPAFVMRFQERTGQRAAVSRGALAGTVDFDLNDA